MRHLIVVFAWVTASEACSCLPFTSLKDVFCASDFVSHVKVKSEDDLNRNPDDFEDISYTVEHICVYRPD
ncbi:hypothetical protein COOONC_26879 [Cooperia oncophora]